MKHLIHQLSKFASVGIVATGVHALVYGVVGRFLEPMLANLIAFLIAFLFSYLGHFLWTFRDQTQGREVHKAFAYQFRFLLVALSGLLLNSLAVWVVTEWLQVDYLYAVFPMVFVVPLVTFAFAKGWAFK
jgi:putative flippase GtrA